MRVRHGEPLTTDAGAPDGVGAPQSRVAEPSPDWGPAAVDVRQLRAVLLYLPE